MDSIWPVIWASRTFFICGLSRYSPSPAKALVFFSAGFFSSVPVRAAVRRRPLAAASEELWAAVADDSDPGADAFCEGEMEAVKAVILDSAETRARARRSFSRYWRPMGTAART